MAPRGDAAFRLLQDRAEIRALVVRYATGVDRRDFDLVASCFAPDVSGEFGGEERADRDALIDFIRGVSYFHTTMHFMGNHYVHIEGDTAWSDTIAMITHRATNRDGSEFALDMSNTTYHDKLERRGGRFVIVRRGEEPRYSTRGTHAVSTADPAVRWLLDRAEIEDFLLGEARECAERASATCLVGNIVARVEGDTARVLSREMVTYRDPPPAPVDPSLRAWKQQRPPERTTATCREHAFERRGDRFVLTGRTERPTPPELSAGGAPRSASRELQQLIDAATLRDATAMQAYRDDRSGVEGEAASHLLGNQTISISPDGDTAAVETYTYITRQEPTGDRSPWAEGARRYADTWSRAGGGGWTLARRDVLTNRVGGHSENDHSERGTKG